MASMQQDIMSANEEAEMRYDLERRRLQNSSRPMTVAEFNVAQRKKAAAAAAMHAYVNLPPKLIGRAEDDPPPPPLPHKDVGYGSADNSPQHRSEFLFPHILVYFVLSFVLFYFTYSAIRLGTDQTESRFDSGFTVTAWSPF